MNSVLSHSISLVNPNPSCGSHSPLKRSQMALCASYLPTPRSLRTSIVANGVSPQGLGPGFLHLNRARGNSWSRSIFSLAASNEESHSEIEVEKEKDGPKSEAEESQEAWKEIIASFKEQALKMQTISQEASEIYSKKALVVAKETSKQLKIQADKAKHELSVIAKEISEEGKKYLSTAAQDSPEPVKEIVETFHSSVDDLYEISKVHDFCLGIPYGMLLSLGGFLYFMLTGSISAIRFGVVLGGTLLAISISSLRAYKRGESFSLALKGQGGIAGIIFLREIQILFQRPTFLSYFTTFTSGAMLVFYLYRMKLDREQSSRLDKGTEN